MKMKKTLQINNSLNFDDNQQASIPLSIPLFDYNEQKEEP